MFTYRLMERCYGHSRSRRQVVANRQTIEPRARRREWQRIYRRKRQLRLRGSDSAECRLLASQSRSRFTSMRTLHFCCVTTPPVAWNNRHGHNEVIIAASSVNTMTTMVFRWTLVGGFRHHTSMTLNVTSLA